jgi:integrase
MAKDLLSDTAIRRAKPGKKARKLNDGAGLFLLLNPAGSRWWRFRYRFDGKEKTLSMGTYPAVGLREARKRRDTARERIAAGVDPGEVRKKAKAKRASRAANTFEAVAREWMEKKAAGWVPTYASKVKLRLENDVFPWIGACPIEKVRKADMVALLERIEQRGAIETAYRILRYCRQIFSYADATRDVTNDPTRNLYKGLTARKPKAYAAITEPGKAAELMRAIDGYQGAFVTKCALQLLPLVFVRSGELRGAEWPEFDLDAAEWRIPAERMKMGAEHLVPLSRQAVSILLDLYAVTGSGRYVFPGVRTASRPMSENTVNAALRRMGFDKDTMTGHGFRAMARTMLDEVLHERPDFIEHQLAHAVRDPNGRAYNRTTHLPERRRMMQAWADYLDGLKAGGNVVPIHAGRSA